MGAWIGHHFAWSGLTSRTEYCRWLPLMIVVEIMMLGGLLRFGERGTIHVDDFGWPASLLFLAAFVYSIGWLFLTARRLRSANISRAWLIFTVLGLTFHIGDTYVSGSAVASLLLTGVGATVRDRSEAAVG